MSSSRNIPAPPGSLRSMREDKEARKVEPNIHSFDGSLAMLHKIAWAKQSPESVFRRHTVRRDEDRADAETLENAFVLDWGDRSTPPRLLIGYFSIKSILVRDEYQNMLRDIIRFADGSEEDGGGDSNMATDVAPSSVYNPFETELVCPNVSGAIVSGTPGIGKSVFLIYVLALRLLFGRTTVFQRSKSKAYVLNNEGVFRLPCPIRNDLDLPRGTWFLIDSNLKLSFVPMEYSELSNSCEGFILQAAYPRIQHVAWARKASRRVANFWMAPWSLAELIACRDLQWRRGNDYYTESALRSAMDPVVHARDARSGIGELTRNNISDLLHEAVSMTSNNNLSEYILVFDPIPGDRSYFNLKIATNYLVEKILDHLRRTGEHAASTLYRHIIAVPAARTGAGYPLELAFMEQFSNEGEWPITAMAKLKDGDEFTYWNYDVCSPRKKLRLGYQGPMVTIENNPTKVFRPLERHYFTLEEILTLERRFYIPHPSSSRYSFDAFVYDNGQRTATVFQLTVAKENEISTHGLDWLKNCGVQCIDLVVVTPRLWSRDELNIKIANSHEDKLRGVYCFQLEG